MDPSLDRYVDFLNRVQIRATYGAVARAAGHPPQAMGDLLGSKCPRASWVVKATTGEPTGYSDSEKHPDLHRTPEIIKTAEGLIQRIRSGR